ncbi:MULTISPECIES: GNAT family N-acetyltransferase [unclassified Bradyrhizobium]|uniref:GNAT family N-acetyltransferase n=1 Tax=unclassified Bradyrhizobium TaxID=2631580 RepID=UPI0028E8AA1D|nr:MULTISPECIES: GNAT family N-acetyltransferase [unclassified Bradyrhizobium]
MYHIREVDACDEDVADSLADLHRQTFLDRAALPDFDAGHWWIAYEQGVPVAFAGLVPSSIGSEAGYFCRVGVAREHCGRGLQLRLMRAAEWRGRRNGWSCIVSDTTDNVISANNFIRGGYRLFRPQSPWGWSSTLYWRKLIEPFECSVR